MGVLTMPTYDFECDKCGTIAEYFVPLTTTVPEKCICGKKSKLNKLETFSSSKPIIKVQGCYETDYKHRR
jgi:putative FmdB family regulatory protein